MDTHARGTRYEALAAEHLLERGWRIVERNFRSGRKEIDLVVARRGVVAFVEVKGRRGGGCGHPLESVTARKRREIETVARGWMFARGRGGAADATVYRFDAVAVLEYPDGRVAVEHVEDAWRPGR